MAEDFENKTDYTTALKLVASGSANTEEGHRDRASAEWTPMIGEFLPSVCPEPERPLRSTKSQSLRGGKTMVKCRSTLIAAILILFAGHPTFAADDSPPVRGTVTKITAVAGSYQSGGLFSTSATIGAAYYLFVKDKSGNEIKFFVEDDTYLFVKDKSGNEIKVKERVIKLGDEVIVNSYFAGRPFITAEGKGTLLDVRVAQWVEIVKRAPTKK